MLDFFSDWSADGPNRSLTRLVLMYVRERYGSVDGPNRSLTHHLGQSCSITLKLGNVAKFGMDWEVSTVG